ncbi:MAG TPA: hypothetical protein VMM56_09845, partial [Planctomycetaceae bacterium]|nr:hypothetical protein [Planctomycetaceae bacterium]
SHQKVVEKYPSLMDLNYWGTDFETSSVDWKNGGYWCTPINSIAFGWTGGDGVHFSFLLSGNKVDESSPVIMTVPANSSLPNIIVAENFAEFLRLGLNHGFFGLEQLSYEPEAAFMAINNVEWTTQKTSGLESLLRTSHNQRIGLDFTREILELGVSDFNKEKYDALQIRYLPQLILPDAE